MNAANALIRVATILRGTKANKLVNASGGNSASSIIAERHQSGTWHFLDSLANGAVGKKRLATVTAETRRKATPKQTFSYYAQIATG